jgi:8-oxo-dGTP pyrophosphatase MutT (NUDIX family)
MSYSDWLMDRFELRHVRDRFAAAIEASVDPEPAARAAVAIVLREGNAGVEALFIRRAEDPRDPWSGHVAFPGGRHDPVDADLAATAVRETREEVGLDLSLHGEAIGRLSDLPAVARGKRVGMTISPFVWAIDHHVDLVPNEEVAETIWAPLLPYLRGDLRTIHPYVYQGRPLELPAHRLGERVIWGLTYQMLETLLDLFRTK